MECVHCRRWHGGALEGDIHGRTPFDYACDKLMRCGLGVDLVSYSSSNDSDDDDDDQEGGSAAKAKGWSDEAELLWSKLQILAEEMGPSLCPATGETLLLHSLLYLGAPSPIVRHALSARQCLTRTDQRGRTPLSIACANPSTLPDVFAILLHPVTGCPAAAEIKDVDGRTPLHRLVSSEGRGWRRGWDGYRPTDDDDDDDDGGGGSSGNAPRNQRPSDERREDAKGDGGGGGGGGGDGTEDDGWKAEGVVGTVLRAYPEALAERDGDGNFPFVLAAAAAAVAKTTTTSSSARNDDAERAARGLKEDASDDGHEGGDGDDDDDDDVSLTYALLREDPSVLTAAVRLL